ncbi:MAG: phosphate uptake regulator PhoU [Candidatus Methanofastidiosa archaeon]|nr:phosphate uptake regulator PhoU [Candidatus Methanofastidiosa archaeon]
MEIRKLQYSGKGTFILSLPKRWLDKHSIDKGDKFGIIEMENGLFITPKFNEARELTANLKVSKYISREITARYTYGFNKVVISGPISSQYRTIITQTLSELMGYDIVEETEDHMIIKDLLNPSQLNISKTLRREFFLASLMHKDAMTALHNMDKELAKDIIRRDSEVNKLFFFTVRQIRTALQDTTMAESIGVNHLESIDLRVVSKCIEEIGDHAVHIAESIIDLEECSSGVMDLMVAFGNSTLEYSNIAMDSFLNANKEKSSELLNKKNEFYQEKRSLDEEVLNCKDAIVMRNILDSIRGIGDKAFEIASLAYKP